MRWLILLSTAVVLAFTSPANAQYPDKPVRIIVPFIAGSTPDTAARRIAQRLTVDLRQQFVIENRGGAAGNIGAEVAARTTPDGYTLVLIANSHAINPALYGKLSYDLLKDFTPICIFSRGTSMMVVPPSSPAKSVGEFIDLARAQPGKLNYASGGAGSPAHLSAEAFRLATGVDYVHVPFKGAPEIVRALLGEHVQVGFPTFDVAFNQVKQGMLRPLATMGSKRAKVLPDVPTLLEVLPKGFSLEGWLGLAAPTGVPAEIVARLSGAVAEALKDAAFRETLESGGNEATFVGPEAFASMLPGELIRWADLVKRVGAKLE